MRDAKTYRTTMYAYVTASSLEGECEPNVLIFDSDDQSDDSWALFAAVPITVTIPADFDPRPAQIASLREKIKRTQAEAQQTVTKLEAQIATLLAIEHAPSLDKAEGA